MQDFRKLLLVSFFVFALSLFIWGVSLQGCGKVISSASTSSTSTSTSSTVSTSSTTTSSIATSSTTTSSTTTTTSGLGSWVEISTRQTRDLSGLWVQASEKVLVVGGVGTILRTIDSGVNFTSMESHTTEALNAIVRDDSIGDDSGVYWTFGNNSLITSAEVNASDFGNNWTAFPSPLTGRVFNDSAKDSGGTIWTVGSGGALIHYHPSSGWVSSLNPGTKDLYGIATSVEGSTTYFYAVGKEGKIYPGTYSGGIVSWLAPSYSSTVQDLKAVAFKNKNIGIAVGGSGHYTKTTNGGLSWEANSWNPPATFESVTFVPGSNDVWIVGRDGVILYSTNEGVSFVEFPSPTTMDLFDVVF